MECFLLFFFRAYLFQFALLLTTPYSAPSYLSAHFCNPSAHHRHSNWQHRAAWLLAQGPSYMPYLQLTLYFCLLCIFCLLWTLSFPHNPLQILPVLKASLHTPWWNPPRQPLEEGFPLLNYSRTWGLSFSLGAIVCYFVSSFDWQSLAGRVSQGLAHNVSRIVGSQQMYEQEDGWWWSRGLFCGTNRKASD